jgi:hypothetical protein
MRVNAFIRVRIVSRNSLGLVLGAYIGMCSITSPSMADEITPKVDAAGNVTWGDPPYSSKTPLTLKDSQLNINDTFHWTNGSKPDPNDPTKQLFTDDPRYGGFSTGKKTGSSFKFYFPKDADGKTPEDLRVTRDRDGSQILIESFAASILPKNFTPFDTQPDIPFNLPWIASLGSGPPIYMGVDLGAYLLNSDAALNWHFDNGWSLEDLGVTIVDGQIPGVAGLVFSTSMLEFDPNSSTGFVPMAGEGSWLNSDAYEAANGAIGVVGTFTTAVPEPSAMWLVLAASAAVFWRHKSKGWHGEKKQGGSSEHAA